MSESKLILSEIAKIMKSGRHAIGLTQEEMGTKLGILQSALSKMEAAKLEPSAMQWMRFAKLTRVKPDVLMTLIEGF